MVTKKIFIFLVLMGTFLLQGQQIVNNSQNYFEEAYIHCKLLPQGLLESVSYSYTRFNHLDESYAESSNGMPRFWTIMGLVEDGKGYFRENLKIVAKLSGYSEEEIKKDVRISILAYALSLENIIKTQKLKVNKLEDLSFALLQLSEIPYDSKDEGNSFAFESFLYQVYSLMNEEEFANSCGFEAKSYDLKSYFGENYEILRAKEVLISEEGIFDENNNQYKGNMTSCPDYNVSNCNWIASPNYSSRNGTSISALVMHTVQGSYSSCVSWFQNPNASASAHYVIRSSDGQICQMVRESNKAWHIGSENPYTIGYEHEGYIEQTGWYTTAMYTSSANLTKNICTKYGINKKRTFNREILENGTLLDDGLHVLAGPNYCTKIAGHQHYPNQTHTDPGKNWDWEYYYKLVNAGVGEKVTYTALSGTFYDSGNSTGNYGNDERKFWLIKPTGASKITLTFSSFDLEDNYDYILVYNGQTEFSPLIGKYSVNSPGTVQSTGGALLVEFRSDCGTTAPGWVASWNSVGSDVTKPTTSISSPTSASDDFSVSFTDADNQGISKAYYSVMYKNASNTYLSNTTNGFLTDYFDINTINTQWNVATGSWTVTGGSLYQSDEANTNTNIYAYLKQTLSNQYVYHFRAQVGGTQADKRFGFHFFADNGSLSNRGNSYFIWFRLSSNQLEFYKVENNTFTLKKTVNNVEVSLNTWYDFKVIYDRTTGQTIVYVNDVKVGEYTYSPAHSMSIGKYVSFRTANCTMKVDYIRVLRSRTTSGNVTVKVGASSTDDVKLTSTFKNTTARVISLARDLSSNLSAFAAKDITINYAGAKLLEVDNYQQKIEVYPNPFVDKICIRGDYDRYTIYDVNGRVVYVNNFDGNNDEVDASGFERGIYIIVVEKNEIINKFTIVK